MPPLFGPEYHRTVELSLEKNKALSAIYYEFLKAKKIEPTEKFSSITITPQERSWFFTKAQHVKDFKITNEELDAFLSLYHVKVAESVRTSFPRKALRSTGRPPLREDDADIDVSNMTHDENPVSFQQPKKIDPQYPLF